MKSTFPVLTILLAFATQVHSQKETDPNFQESSAASGSRVTPRISVQLDTSPFVPPAEKARKQMPEMKVRSVANGTIQNGKRVKIVLADSSELPDLEIIREELARKPVATEPNVAIPINAPVAPHRFLSLGATVIDHTMSHVNWMDEHGNQHWALCGFDISLLEDISDFKVGETDYSLFLTHSHHLTERDGRFQADGFTEARVAPGAIVFSDGQKEPETRATADLEVIRDLILTENSRLVKFQKARVARLEAARKWREANPEPPQDVTVWLRPHSGSRYLEVENLPVTDTKGGAKQ